MKFSAFLLASLYSLNVLAASKPAADGFKSFHSKSISSGPIELDDTSYDRITSAPRDYTIAVLLTALESKYGCQLCRDFQPEWELIVKSYNKGDKKGEGRLLFGTLDFSKGKATFQKVGFCVVNPFLRECLIADEGCR